MKVYRKNIFIINHVSELPVKQIGNTWYNPQGHKVALHPQINTVIHTGADFEGYTNVRTGFNIQANSYYRFDGTKKSRSRVDQNLYAKWTSISANEAASLGRIAIFNIMEGTYTGKDMGERSIVATIDFPSRIDFQIGDYVEFEIANLERTTSIHGGSGMEKFYIYTMPTVKKVASRLSYGKAFQHTVTFYPCQYELATVKMRDVLQDISSGVIYTGYDEFSFYGGANTLMKRIMAVLDERFGHTGVEGKDYWSYRIADSINEDRNTALEKFQFDFSDSNVMEALLKLNDAEGINTKFFINERMIYVGFKRPYIVGVDEHNQKRDIPFEFAYGKTSHLPIETNHGNLYTITKSNGSASPITRLYAYGAERNLQRFYCSDRIKTGRYVNKLMLPSFEDDGRTDYIDSPEGIARFGIREGTKTFDNIYPSLRFFYYGNLRDVKYCIKLMGSGLESDADGVYDNGTMIVKTNITEDQLKQLQAEVKRYKDDSLEANTPCTITVDGKSYTITVAEADVLINSGKIRVGGGMKRGDYHYPIARIQCYRVEELLDQQGNHTGLNYLVESAPPVDLAVFCHATGKVVKCVLYADDGQPSTRTGVPRSVDRQMTADENKVPTRTEGGTDYIVGSCFAVHDGHPTESNKHFECGHLHPSLAYPGLPNSDQRAAWFTDADSISTSKDGAFYKPYDEYKNQVSIHQIHYTDDHWITDVYEFTDYHQESFNRQGYSAYCWPRVNKYYPNSQADNIEVNAVVDVGPVLIEDTDLNTSQGQQQKTFDIYMRDMGFKINDQTWFGDKCFLFDTCKINFLDGNLGGYEFEMPAESDQDKLGSIYVPALAPDGTRNPEFFDLADNPAQAEQAYLNGAFWRIVAKRAETEVDRYWVPNVNLNASAGDHVVFLDIFMPDLYIRVAEQRLLKEAKKYLDANDDGDIQYSFDFDKVRMLKQPTFPLQMREGAIMRVIDDDLDVGTVNAQKTVFEDKNGLVTMTSLVKLTATVDEGYEIITRDCDYIEAQELPQATYSTSGGGRTGDPVKYFLTFKRSAEDHSMDFDIESGISIRLYSPAKVQRQQGGGSVVLEWYCWNYKAAVTEIVSAGIDGFRAEIPNLLTLDGHAQRIADSSSKVYVGYSVRKQTLTPVYDESVLPIGRQIFCVANSLTDFKCNKHYEIEMDILEPDLLVEDTPSKKQMFALVNGLGDGETFYYPDYTAVDITLEGETFKRFRISFDLPQDFSDDKDYYPAFLCASDGVTEAVHVRLWSIVERDDEALEDLNYVDLAIDTVTIKFHDNTREKDVSLQDGQEPERLRDNLSEMSREVSATVKEESRATAWAQLMDRMTEAEQLQDQTLDFYQSLVDASRKHYLELLNLKNNIFDPDGTCKETFLQIMMLQVGADSMNYQLKYTHYSMNGHTANCGLRFDTDHPTDEIIDPVSGKAYIDSFFIGNAEEVLDHYVYTENPTNGEGGRWYPQERNNQWKLHKILPEGQTTEIYPVYFIALKASLTDPRDCHWVCEPIQHATNELVNGSTGYFYFNWGILAPESESVGKYTLTETRGNAYMYGDNLICGQISTLAGNSYFDLTHGNFVLSKYGPDGNNQYHEGLTYIDGVLTIYGINDGSETSILTRLGLTEGVANGAATAAANAAAAAAAAQATVDNVIEDGIITHGTEKYDLKKEWQEIAGDNMLYNTNGTYKKAITQAAAYGITSSQELSNLGTALGRLEYAMKEIVGYSNNAWTGANMQYDTYVGADYENPSTHVIAPRYDISMNIDGVITPIDRDKFAALWRAYYDAEIALLNAVEKVIDERAIGGENLLYVRALDKTFSGQDPEAVYKYELTYYSDDTNPRTHTYLPAGKYVFSAKGLAYGVENSDWVIQIHLEAINSSGTVKKSIQLSAGDMRDKVIEFTESCYIALQVEIWTQEQHSDTDGYVQISDMQLQLGDKSTAYNEYIQHLTNALHGTTDIAGGLLLTNLIMLRNELNNVVAGMSGMSDGGKRIITVPGLNGINMARIVDSEGVTLWGGGDYQQALNQAMGLARELPILLTKTGIRSRIGCFEVVSANSVAIYDENMTYRILLTSGQSMSLKMQQKVSGKWTDLLIINTDDISNDYEIFTMGRTSNCPYGKRETDTGLSQFFIKFTDENGDLAEQLTIPAGCTCDLSSQIKLHVASLTSMSGWKLNSVTMVCSVALVKINDDSTYTTIDSMNVTVGSSRTDANAVDWEFYLSNFTGNYPNLAAGKYGLLFTVDHFNRMNGAGVVYTEHMYNSNWSNCSMGISLMGNVHFSKSSAEDRTVMKIGRNGMLIAHSANSYFMAKNDSTNMDVEIGGLPTSPDASKPNSLYKSGGYIMIN